VAYSLSNLPICYKGVWVGFATRGVVGERGSPSAMGDSWPYTVKVVGLQV
jgi:hypothetical protein